MSRSHIATSQEPSLSVRSVVTKSRLSSSSASSHSSVSFVRSHRTSSQTSVSSHPPSVLSRNPLRHTSYLSSRIPTCALSTPSVSPSSQRTSSLPVVSAASALRCFLSYLRLWPLLPPHDFPIRPQAIWSSRMTAFVRRTNGSQ